MIEETEFWVNCVSCGKWRRLKSRSPEDIAFTCSLGPDPRYRSCSIPEEPAATHTTHTHTQHAANESAAAAAAAAKSVRSTLSNLSETTSTAASPDASVRQAPIVSSAPVDTSMVFIFFFFFFYITNPILLSLLFAHTPKAIYAFGVCAQAPVKTQWYPFFFLFSHLAFYSHHALACIYSRICTLLA